MKALAHPSSLPRVRPRTRRNRAPEKVISPATSRRLLPGSLMLTMRVRETARVAIPMGMLTKKIHRQPRPLVSAPPTRGPTATAPPTVAPQAAMAVPRSRPRKSWPMRASEVANIAAPPTPWTARPTMRKVAELARPQTNDARVKMVSPATKIRLRPNRSARVPWVRIRAARDRA